MTRRAFLKLATALGILFPVDRLAAMSLSSADQIKKICGKGSGPCPPDNTPLVADLHLRDYLLKVRNPDSSHPDDVILDTFDRELLRVVVEKFTNLCEIVGCGNFAVLGFDDARTIAGQYSSISAFTSAEMSFLEKIFFRDAADYGFYGKKQIEVFEQEINEKNIVKVAGSGNFLFKGESLEKYRNIKSRLGDDAILTSGIRGIVKQFALFLGKAERHAGNLSLASRSLAPPGYSYHAMGDFDIGQKGLGEGNFSERFTATNIFRQLADQGFVQYRYERDNMFGVRYEPWHVKI